ncbi:MAG: prevent-host-death protein [Gammaproteobacteria bacterium HGW-Gammaproteobacteria-3]|nr:MAG: prevent-host-death protein [Gammaproteobacteria bacterium HGW-Gammaproteobacteria-3]
MTHLQISEDILPLGQFKTQASQLLKCLNSHNRPIVITQNGKPAAVVLSPAEFDRLNTQARFIFAVQQGLNDEQAGRVIDDDALDAILERELSTV